MICTRRCSAATGVCVALVLGLSGVPAFARFITMPPTARTWLDIRGTAGVEIDADGFPVNDSIGQFFASEGAIPFAEYDSVLPLMQGNRLPNLHLFASGSADGNALKSFISGQHDGRTIANMQMYNSSRDTFTLAGTPEQVGQSVTLVAHFDADGTASLFGGSNGNPAARVGTVNVTAKMGTFTPVLSPGNREDLRVNAFDAASTATFQLNRFAGMANVSGGVDLHTTHTFTAVVGTPFDIAYGLNLDAFDSFTGTAGINGYTVDLAHTGMIDFDVPAGYSLTSVLGWKPIPEPSSIGLLGLCAVGLLLAARRDRC